MNGFIETLERIWAIDLVRAVAYLVIALVAGWLASFIVKKLAKLIGIEKWEKKGQQSTAKLIGKLAFLIVFLLFLPAVLSALGLEGVSGPISDFASAFTKYIPRLIAAGLLIFIGIFLGGILSETLSGILAKLGADDFIDRLKSKRRKKEGQNSENDAQSAEKSVCISDIAGKVVKALISLISIVEAMIALNIEAISRPAISIIEAVFGVIPELILAGIVISIGAVVASLAAELIESLLLGIDLDGAVGKLVPKMKGKGSVTKAISIIIRWIIVIFIAAEGARILGLTVILDLAEGLIAYAPMLIKAILIGMAALFGANLVDSALSKSGTKIATAIAKTIIYVVAAFMILSQLGFASVIVNYAFIISLSALAVAFAVAFGIGGRDFAKKTLESVKLPEGKCCDNTQSQSNESTPEKKQ